MSISNLSGDDAKKLTRTVDQAVSTLQEIDDLKESMKDLLKNVAEELSLTPKSLNKAVNIAFKGRLEEQQAELTEVEAILVTTGRA